MIKTINADDKLSLPEPLTLEHALSLADEAVPSILLQDSHVQTVRAGQTKWQTNNSLNIDLQLGVFSSDLDSTYVRRADHSRAGIIITQDIYDFGYTDSYLVASEWKIKAEQLTMYELRAQRRYDIMQAYFNVLIADLSFSYYNEAMAVVYIKSDRAKDKLELGQATDLQVLEAEAEYQRIFSLRSRSEHLQRQTRARLATVLNRPTQLSTTLAIPNLSVLNRKLPEFEVLQERALQNNYTVLAAMAKVRAAELDLSAERFGDNPVLSGRIEAFQFESNLQQSDEVRAELILNIPLYTSKNDASVAFQQANLYQVKAELAALKSTLRDTVLAVWFEIQELNRQRKERMKMLEYREMALDESRALYEMEVKSDLGTSMVSLSNAQLALAQTEYNLALAWMKLDILVGDLELKPLSSPLNYP